MVNMADDSKFPFNQFTGPLIDGSTPYSGQGMHELRILSPYLRKNWNGQLDLLPSAIGYQAHWQYVTSTHLSDSRKM